MRVVVALVAVLVGSSCSERPLPPQVAPPEAPMLDAGQPREPVDAGPRPVETRNVLQLPDPETLSDDPNRPAELMRLMLRDPVLAERRLAQLDTPSSWQVALLANFGLRRGDHSLAPPREGDLPAVHLDAGAVTEPGPAWIAVPLAELHAPGPRKKKTPLVATLPIGSRVEVESLDGGLAFVSVALASSVDFGEASDDPVHIETTVLKGQLEAAALASEPIAARTLIESARAQPETGQGPDRAVALWYRALLMSHDDATRAGLLAAAWNAHRPSWAVTAALDRSFAPGRALALSWGCRGDAPQRRVLRWPLPKKAPPAVCATFVSEQPDCEGDPEGLRRRLEKARADLDASGLLRAPTLHFTVDARLPRAAFVSSARLEYADPCADFPEVTVEGWGASFRVLHLPLGTASTQVTVAVSAYNGVEYAVISAASEPKIAAWLRSRSHVHWTLSRAGDLELSLRNGDTGYRLEPDVSAATLASEPLRSCECP